ncbi:hypothetical protein C8Q76DRAFT_189941 [Earliella scabrosa]|nr:hypothetical protein C8Q76DRAFT_189941 [Earliella scabrosa]
MIVDHIYTGRFEQAQDRDCLLHLLELAHRWEMKAVQEQVEVLLVPTITPGTFLELRDHAEAVGATMLLEAVDEFTRENAFALDQIINWEP